MMSEAIEERSRRRMAIRAGLLLRSAELPVLRSWAGSDPNLWVRCAALWSLGRFASNDDVDLLKGALTRGGPVGAMASWSLRRCQPGHLGSSEDSDPIWLERCIHDVLNIVQTLVGELDELAVDPDLQDKLTGVDESSRFLINIGGSLLDARRDETVGPRLDLEPVDLASVAHQAVGLGPTRLDRERVRVVVPVGLELRTDRLKLTRILLNLIWNACKFSPDDAPVLVVARPREGGAHLEVRDRGPGIPRAERTRLREAFSTGQRSMGRGWGLGLSTAIRLTQSLGGELTIETRAPTGTTVGLRLPSLSSS